MLLKKAVLCFAMPLALAACHGNKKIQKSNAADAQSPNAGDFSDLAAIVSAQEPSKIVCTGIFVSQRIFLSASSCWQSINQPLLKKAEHTLSRLRVLDAGTAVMKGGIKQSGRDLTILAVDDHETEVTTVLGSSDMLSEKQSSQTFIYDCVGDGQCPYLMAGLGRKKNSQAYGLHWTNVPLRSVFSRTGDEFHAGRFSFSVCDGDMGSPLYRIQGNQKFLIGIASRYFTPAESNCAESDGAIYSNTTDPEIKNRIEQLIRENS